jgi:hypothetical protein
LPDSRPCREGKIPAKLKKGEIKMIEIKKFENLHEVKDFLTSLRDEFRLTNFDPILSLVEPAYYRYDLYLRLDEEGNYGRRSSLFLKMEGGADWGPNDPPTYNCSLIFDWTTGSGHVVQIHGEITDFYTGEGNFTLSIGEDKSTHFYPVIQDLAAAGRRA